MCDSLPYFGIIQGSTYHNMLKTNGNAVSLLINDDHLDRVYIDEEILITRWYVNYFSSQLQIRLLPSH